jgi:hypothetical protein
MRATAFDAEVTAATREALGGVRAIAEVSRSASEATFTVALLDGPSLQIIFHSTMGARVVGEEAAFDSLHALLTARSAAYRRWWQERVVTSLLGE